MAQTTESALEADECVYVVTSAPDNAFCVIDTDGDGGEDGDGDSACCDNKGGSGETSCCCGHNVAPLQLRHSASSSTALSSTPSGISSPSPPAFLTSGLPSASCGCGTGDASAAGPRCGTVGNAQGSAAASKQPQPQLHVQHDARALALPDQQPAAKAVVDGGAVAVVAATRDRCDAGGSGESDLMGAFGAVTSDQWAAFQAAVGGSASADVAATPAAAPVAAGCSATPAAATAVGQPARLAGAAVATGGGGGGSEGAEGMSPGGSATSIASLWAAVNSVASAAVYDSTDDNAMSGLALSRTRGWSNTSAAAGGAAAAAPAVAVPAEGGYRQPASHTSQSSHHHHHHYHPHHNHNHNHQQHQLEMFLAARHSHPHPNQDGGGGAAPPLQLPALMAQQPDVGGALSLPGSPSARRTAVSCSAGSGGANGLFAATRNMLLRECYGQEPQPQQRPTSQQHQRYAVATASATADGYCYRYGDGSGHGGDASGYNRAAEQARSIAHSRFSVDMSYYKPRQPYASQQNHPQQQQAQQQQQPTMFQQGNPDSPSRCRNGGGAAALTLPPQPTSYTTYGYRRARSSLAALEQSAAGGGAAVDGGSSSDDEDDTEEATRRITAAFRAHSGMTRCSGWGLLGMDSAPTTPGAEAARKDHWAAATAAIAGGGGSGSVRSGSIHGGGGGGVYGGGGALGSVSVQGARAASGDCGGEAAAGGKDAGGGGDGGGAEDEGDGALTRKRSSYHLTNSHAAVELFLRLNHARQTMDFVKRQTQLFAVLDKAQMGVWEALTTLNELREYEAVLMAEAGEAQEVSELSLLEHAFQTAELCRLHHPDLDWLHLVGLLHGLGKLLAHRRFGSQPQWAICGETYPLGCRFSPHILGSQYFTANPDRRRRLYNTPTGLYDPGCGLLNVVMSWSAPEYLYLVLVLNNARLPQDALWVLRHAKFFSLTRPHSCYLPLCSGDDLRRLPLLRSFQSLAAYRRSELPEGFALRGEERTAYYSGLIAKYMGEGKMLW